MAEELDVVVVGAGLAGSAAAWAAARRGMSVAVLEQFEPGHQHGSSHGSARIVRRAYRDGFYARQSGRAFELWREIEQQAGTALLRMLGGLDFGPRRDVATVAAGLAEAGVEHEVLDAAAAERRWPGMRFDGPVVFHPQAGTVDAARAVTAFLAAAVRDGAQVRTTARVSALVPGEHSATVRLADGSTLRARRVVVAAGPWVAPLLAGLVRLPPLRVTRQQVCHFPRRDPAATPWPSVIHENALRVYHLAGGRDGGPGDARKIGEHDAGPTTTADADNGAIDPSARARLIEYVRRWLPGLEPTPQDESTCLYTSTPSEDFLLDVAGPLIVCSACSGHGAKFAPLIGELVAGLVDGSAGVPDRFRLDVHASARSGGVSL